ncbi:16S rRNA (adenine(1518)-N(6)/adenine(1519)-N(6))-dimethyltransferase RsmA [Helicobacter typhlonius]|uniref:16S rRNA (adenine(1518)-N(6)/adenine(1519)-N(6))- dimethyltransferase RsmA n=1 Tax=Helicobacter typhlonius TaxID=76936 RepID=UPI002FE0CDD4
MKSYKAKKHFGQNFLQDSHYLHKIIQSIPTLPIQCVEIGVGLGDLTQELLKIESLIAYEVDLDLCSLLDKKFSSHIQSGRLKIIYENVLNFPQEQQWLYENEYKVVSNLPYYIATHIILRLLRDDFCRALLVMTQKEVAQKFCATSGKSDFCALSVLTQSFGEAQLLFDVPNTAFSPVPKVTSSVFVIQKHCAKPFKGFSLYDLESFLKCAFIAPRKTLFKNLSMTFDKCVLQEALESVGISLNARAHEVETKSFHHILQILKKGHSNGRKECNRPT